MEVENLKKFTESFFKNLKCDVSWKGECLIINNIPADFEKIYGKKSPYILIFNPNLQIEDSELITKGSALLKVMAGYLENRAQTTLMKLEVDEDFNKLISSNFNLFDFEIYNLSKKQLFDYIMRFTFISSFQYLNEREQMINTIYVKDNNVLDNFNIDSYNNSEGKKEEIKISDVKEQYNLAKEKLRHLISNKTEEITKYLNQGLEIEIRRIRSHYMHEIDEINQEINKGEANVLHLEEKLKKVKENEIEAIQEKIIRLKQNIEKLKNSEELERFRKEEEFYITDEKNKHGLNISNNLANTTIIYYPIFSLKFSLRNKNFHSRNIEFEYNPVFKNDIKINCDSCKEDIKDIYVCNSGHISCKKCLKLCTHCRGLICQTCEKINCSVCGRDICIKCRSKCAKCLKYTCSSDITKDSFFNKNICTNCSKYCPVCRKFSDKVNFVECSTCRNQVCTRCIKIDFNTRKRVCLNCFKTPDFRG
jgi:hypothetical protein